MDPRIEEYVSRQRKFWNVETADEARFGRVDLYGKDEEGWEANAEEAMNAIFDGVTPQPGWSLLEIGCGVGRLIPRVLDRVPGSRLVGVDISASMIDFARQALADDPRVTLAVNSGYDIPMVPTDSVDVAYSVDVFIHIFDHEIAQGYAREVSRVLRPGGLFRFNVRNSDPARSFGPSLGGRLARWSYRLGLRSEGRHTWAPGEPAEFNGNKYSRSEIEKLVADAGLTPVSAQVGALHTWVTAQKRPPA